MRFKDFSLSAWVAGGLAVLISYCGPLVIFIQAAQAGGMGAQMLSSWIWAISLGAGLSGLLLSVWLRQPIITAWSAPGTALLLSLFPQISMAEVVGAYLTAAMLVIAIGVSGCFERIVQLIPRGIAAGMMAGILFQFGVQAFRASAELPLVVFAMLAAYLVGRRLWPRYAIVLVAGVGLAVATLLGETRLQMLEPVLASPVFVAPAFGWSAFFSFTVPLLLVSLTGQYLPGMSLLRLAGYQTPSRAVLAGTGLASLLVACFGGISIVLASITAALCTGSDAHPDARRRYVAGIANGIFYLVGAAFAGSIVLLFNAFPPPFIAALAGLALIGAIASNLDLLAQERGTLEASVIAFLATASGMSLFGLGAAFWGVVLGIASHLALRPRAIGASHASSESQRK
ncbi:benzoate/H(+) symporter BenE family transporter [Pantoea sp. 18069]|uniref:benzoate/H(+) symporter BenE family transporter n=1 Tax=Pantoea sp. 18069 TaxID=2681415 RepID=UPI001357B970|nr:benzoate/H(+) symporter BenE family transporter [Pantoea sp. 18069]